VVEGMLATHENELHERPDSGGEDRKEEQRDAEDYQNTTTTRIAPLSHAYMAVERDEKS
jgi:hypothetical protein